ncbi:Hypothetical predicted protein, partial [Podarcis lilfordi]
RPGGDKSACPGAFQPRDVYGCGKFASQCVCARVCVLLAPLELVPAQRRQQ